MKNKFCTIVKHRSTGTQLLKLIAMAGVMLTTTSLAELKLPSTIRSGSRIHLKLQNTSAIS